MIEVLGEGTEGTVDLTRDERGERYFLELLDRRPLDRWERSRRNGLLSAYGSYLALAVAASRISTVTPPGSFTSSSSTTVDTASALVVPTAIVTDEGAGGTTGPTGVNRTNGRTVSVTPRDGSRPGRPPEKRTPSPRGVGGEGARESYDAPPNVTAAGSGGSRRWPGRPPAGAAR